MAKANKGRAAGAKSTSFGRRGISSGVAASTKTKILLLSLAIRAKTGSNLERETPASCALERRPDCATLVKSPEPSTCSKMFLTAMLFPIESTSSAYEEAALRATFLCANGAGAKALAAEQAAAVIVKQ